MKIDKVIMILVLISSLTKVSFASEMTDIESHWAKEEIENAVIDNIVGGYEDKTFRPNNIVTLPEFLKMILSSSNHYLTMVNGVLYPDSYLATAEVNGLIIEGEYELKNLTLTRYDVARIIGRYLSIEDVSTTRSKLKDIEPHEKDTILKLASLGVINGYEDNTFRGENHVTRAEALVMIKRANTVRKELALQKTYDITQCTSYTNYQGHASIGSLFDNVSYEIKNGKIYITDAGRYQKVEGQELESSIFDVSKATKVIKNLVNELGYVGVVFFPSKESYNQLVISYGQNEKRVSNNTNELNIIYYQNQYYDLKKNSRVDIFSEQCYMKISIVHLWQELHEFRKGNFVDSYLKKRLEKGLEGEFGKTYASQITDYIAEKITDTFSKEDNYDTEIGQKIFGKYQVDYYKKEKGLPEFYISMK